MRIALLLLLLSPAALAQNEAMQRELLLRQQQSDAFTLQLRQSQDRAFSRGGPELDARQLSERQRLENLGVQQLQSVTQPPSADSDVARHLLPYLLDRAAQQRLLALPPPVPRKAQEPRIEETPRPLAVPSPY